MLAKGVVGSAQHLAADEDLRHCPPARQLLQRILAIGHIRARVELHVLRFLRVRVEQRSNALARAAGGFGEDDDARSFDRARDKVPADGLVDGCRLYVGPADGAAPAANAIDGRALTLGTGVGAPTGASLGAPLLTILLAPVTFLMYNWATAIEELKDKQACCVCARARVCACA